MCPRFPVPRGTNSYFSQARIVFLDNSYFLRRVRRFWLFDAGNYTCRNYVQYNLVMLVTVAMFIVELCLVVPGLTASRPVDRDSDNMLQWESEHLDKARIIISKDHVCTIGLVLDGPNVTSESYWIYCQEKFLFIKGFFEYPADKMIIDSTPENVKGGID